MSELVKDFRYYAEQAEHQLQLSLGHEADGTRLLIDDDTKTRHVMRAHVYAVLAAAAPDSSDADSTETSMIYRHADGCLCVRNRGKKDT